MATEYWMDTKKFLVILYLISMYRLKDLWNRLFFSFWFQTIWSPLLSCSITKAFGFGRNRDNTQAVTVFSL